MQVYRTIARYKMCTLGCPTKQADALKMHPHNVTFAVAAPLGALLMSREPTTFNMKYEMTNDILFLVHSVDVCHACRTFL